jgi:hypothetical protein
MVPTDIPECPRSPNGTLELSSSAQFPYGPERVVTAQAGYSPEDVTFVSAPLFQTAAFIG